MKSSQNRSKWLVLTFILCVSMLLLVACGGGDQEGNHDGHGADADHAGHGKQDKQGDQQKPATAMKPAMVDPDWKLKKSPLVTSEPAQLRFGFADHKTKQPITDYETYHGKKMHLIVVTQDLSDFQHLHPEMQPDGYFDVNINVPRATNYVLFTDAMSKSQGWINERPMLTVRTPEEIAAFTAAKAKNPQAALPVKPEVKAKLVVDADREQTIDGKQISLTTKNLQVGKNTEFTFTFRDAASGADIKNLQEYLGAIGHLIIISEDSSTFIHTHPINEDERGPKATFSAVFEKPGKYKLWGEFKHNNKQLLVPYVIEVKK